jgi:ParB-like chromosome segregation protein Spo0J
MSELVPQDAGLSDLADRINVAGEQAAAALHSGLLHAREAGRLLLEARAKLPHGRWLPWLAANVRFSERTAQCYMRVAKRWDELEGKAQRVADLSYRDALALLAAPQEAPGGGDEAQEVPVDLIRVGPRFRRDLGDIPGLARSIRRLGLLHPLIITPDYLLAAGRRRLEAVKLLQWETVPAYVRDIDPLLAEGAESTCREDYTPADWERWAKAREEAEREAEVIARQRDLQTEG